jgi:hypothetical protein
MKKCCRCDIRMTMDMRIDQQHPVQSDCPHFSSVHRRDQGPRFLRRGVVITTLVSQSTGDSNTIEHSVDHLIPSSEVSTSIPQPVRLRAGCRAITARSICPTSPRVEPRPCLARVSAEGRDVTWNVPRDAGFLYRGDAYSAIDRPVALPLCRHTVIDRRV